MRYRITIDQFFDTISKLNDYYITNNAIRNNKMLKPMSFLTLFYSMLFVNRKIIDFLYLKTFEVKVRAKDQ
jgi:hypothetical protein